jgi:uncharacterized protein
MIGGKNVKRALLLYGGWDGHQPELNAAFADARLLQDFDVTRSQDLELLTAEALAQFDLLVPVWTFGELTNSQVDALLAAVANGMGMVAWHGAASSFLNSRSHKFLLGGQFVGHPGGNQITYRVDFLGNDPIVEGLESITVTSEQYYLLVDPAVTILATTSIVGEAMEWVAGVSMPIAWKRCWGRGRVFYCALGHTIDVLELAPILSMLRRAVSWTTENRAESRDIISERQMLR